VLGCSVADAARIMGLEGAWVYRSLTRAREALRAWLRDTGDGDTANVLVGRWERSPHRSAVFPNRADISLNSGFAGFEISKDASMPPLLLTPLEAARLLGISRSKVYALMKTGEIDWVTIGACRRIPHGDLVDYVERLHRHNGDGRHGS
jgi:excisionase family DNA binding protein